MTYQRTLYVSDLDGTLLDSRSMVSPASARLISDLTARGALITVATARTPATVDPLMADTATSPEAVVMTGAACWDRARRIMTDVHLLPANHVANTLKECAAAGVHPFVYVIAPDGRTLDVYHQATSLNKAEEGFYLERCNLPLKRFHLATPAPPRALDNTMLFFAMGPTEHIEPLAQTLRRTTDLSVSCYPDIFNPNVSNMEILGPGVNKAAAIRRVANRVGADRVVVFGDNLNDLPMFHIADLAVAVENAQPALKEAADIVIGPNYDNAVARFIEQDFNRIKPL